MIPRRLFISGLLLLLSGCSRQVEPAAASVGAPERSGSGMEPTSVPSAPAGATPSTSPMVTAVNPLSARNEAGSDGIAGAVVNTIRPVADPAASSDGGHPLVKTVRAQHDPSVPALPTANPSVAANPRVAGQLAGRSLAPVAAGAPLAAAGTAAASPSAVSTAAGPVLELPLAVVAAQNPAIIQPGQAAVLERLGNEFLAATEEIPAAANSPGAATVTPPATNEARWIDAQRDSDERFKAMFGYDAFNALQIIRAREAYAETQAAQAASAPSR